MLCPNNCLSLADLQHRNGPTLSLNLQTLWQIVELLLLSRTLVNMANAMTNDKASLSSGLFATSCVVNALGNQCLMLPSANKMAFSVAFMGRSCFL